MHFLLRILCLQLILHLSTADDIISIVPVANEATTTKPDPPVCPSEHEIWTECGHNSCERDCSTFGQKNFSCTPSCIPGCVCEWNYYRNADGECVLLEDCGIDVCPETNQGLGMCMDPCVETCQNLGKKKTCYFLVCFPGCVCEIGFFLNRKGDCVVPEKCERGANEIIDLCSNPCFSDACEDIGKPVDCPPFDREESIKNGTCKPARRCKNKNFRRNINGECVHITKCPPCYGDVNANPSDRCNCNTGYIKDKAGKCVAGPPPNCGQNEDVDICALCDDLTCANVFAGEVARCTKSPGCPIACRCKPGYVRNDKKQCINPPNCCSDPNSLLVSSPNPCAGGTCESPAFANCKTKPPAKGCGCKTGFLNRSATNATCLEAQSCPKKTRKPDVVTRIKY